MTEQLYRWVKASERMPDKEGRAVVKRLGEPMVTDARMRKNDVMVFVYPNGMTWPGYKDFEWLEPYTPSPVSGSLEEAAMEYADKFYPIRGYAMYESDYDYRTDCAKREQVKEHFLAGAAYVKPDIDKVVKQMREENPYCGEIDFSEDARIAWEKSCDKLKELLDKNT